MKSERYCGVDFDAVSGDFGEGISCDRSVGAGVDIGANIFRCDRERNGCGSRVDGDGPFIAGDVSVEFVVVVKKA